MESETVWRALSSSHRRRLLEMMRNGPRTTGQLTKEMPGLTRFAVMQHLGVLEEAGLVLARKEGRQRFNHANPSLIRDLFDQWVSPLAASAAEAAQHLRRYAESHAEAIQMSEQNRNVKIELESIIQAPRDVVYRAITQGYGEWWPFRTRPDAVVYHDDVLGGTMGERWPEGGGLVYGTITMLKPGEKVMTIGIGMMGDYTASNLESLVDVPEGTKYQKRLHLWGEVTPELETMLRDGSKQLIEDSLKTYCENIAKETK